MPEQNPHEEMMAVLRQQRNAAHDGLAELAAQVFRLQRELAGAHARIDELEKAPIEGPATKPHGRAKSA